MAELTDAERQVMAELDAETAAMDMEEERRLIEQSQKDPTRQSYFLRMDRKTVVKTQREYQHCDEHRVPMKIVSYRSAIDHMNKEDAAKRKLVAGRAKSEAARRHARNNRKKR